MSTLQEGDRISNYLLEARVGAGSFGEVWRARHHIFEDKVAIKIPTDPQYVRNLQREGVAIHGLRHPNIVRAIDLDPYADPPYLVMEYVDGPSLRAVIDAHPKGLAENAVLALMRGLLNAMACAHEKNVVHRDIKPANILVAHPMRDMENVTPQAVKVTDFGLGRAGGATTQSMMQSGSLVTDEGRSIAGTLAYMAPEQKEGQEYDHRADLFSCGIVLFELLTGERPQGGETPSALRPHLSESLDRVFQQCYTRPERRFASARDMLASLPGETRLPVPPPAPAPAWASCGPSVRCPACQATAARDDQFCIQCGHQLVERVARCAKCEGFVQRSDRYCIFCGNDLRVLTE